jgi:hypothetical protein
MTVLLTLAQAGSPTEPTTYAALAGLFVLLAGLIGFVELTDR